MIDWKGELFEWMPGCIGIFRHDGECLRTVALNAKMRDILGVTEEDVQTSTCKELLQIHPDDRENLYSSFDQAIIDKRDTLEIKARFYRRKLKQYVWFQANFQFQYRSDGETIVYALYQDVTSRMRMKEKLQHNIKTMRTAMDQCGVYYALYDIDANTITYNSKMQQDFGVPAVAQRNAGKPRRLMTESGRAELIRLEQLLMTGKQDSISLEMEIRRPMRGDWIWSKQNYSVSDRNEQGPPTMIAATALDITKEKEEEKRFSQENMYHQLLFNNMTSVIRINITAWKVLDYAGEYVLIHERENDPFGVMIDHITDEEQKKEFTRIFHRNNLIHLFESGQRQVSYTFRSKRLSGKTLWMKIVLDMTAREGEDIYGFVSLQDVDRNVIKELVRGQVVDSMIDFIAYWNTAANDSQIFTRYECYQVDASFEGKKKVEKLQEQLIDLVIPEEREIINAQMSWEVIHARIQHGLSWDFMYHAQDEELGVRTKRIFAFFLENDESVIVMVQRDVTDIMSEQEKQNAELQRALEIANRASHARDEFLSSMSHDLRTPLNGIIGAAELAKLFGDEVPDMVQEYLDDIISSGHFMLNLVNDILDTNRLASGKLELHLKKIDIQHIIQDMRQIFGVTCADKGINLVFEPGENIHTVYADPVRIQRIFSNLLSNAIKFTPPGGTVYFRAIEREIIGDKYLVTIQVKDTGTGMSEEFQEHMFEIFAQEENDTNTFNIGTGLGLSIVKNLVELMGGTIRCSSKLGVGTEFFVTMPFQLAEEAEEEQSAEKCAIQEELLWDHRILLVEDHDLNAKIVTRLLESKQIQVERAKNGKEAVELYAASAPYSYDAILMDIQMPVMDGIEASKKIRMLERPDARLIPIIALTANVFDVDVQRSKAVEMNAHLVKPIDPQKLFRTLIALWK